MPASPTDQLTAVTRTVAPAGRSFAVSLAQTFPAHPEEVWSALTVGSHLEVWFGRARGEAIEGGSYELPDMEARGTVLAAEEPRRLLLTWEIAGNRSELELIVEPVGPEAGEDPGAGADPAADATRFTLRHTVAADAHWETFGPAATGCPWDAALYGLALHLEDPSADLLPELGRFASSPEGAEFTQAVCEAWAEAHVAAGAHRKPARKASLRTAAFYLGQEPDLS